MARLEKSSFRAYIKNFPPEEKEFLTEMLKVMKPQFVLFKLVQTAMQREINKPVVQTQAYEEQSSIQDTIQEGS